MKKKNFIFIGYAAIVCVLILLKNPTLFSEKLLYNPSLATQESYLRPVVKWQESTSSTGNSDTDTFFRGGIERLGQAKWNYSTQLKIDWTYKNINIGIHGASKASPVADASGVYVGSDSSWFYAFNHDGSVRWKFFAAESKRGIHSTAAIDDTNVYFGTYSGHFYCLNKISGTLIWSRKYGETFGSSPLLFENSLILAVETFKPDGFVLRIDKFTGNTLWLSDFLGEQSHSSPAISLKTRQLFLGANNATFFSLDLDSGSLRWKVPLGGHMKGTPIVVEDRVYFSDWGSAFSSLDVQTGQSKWKVPLKETSQASATYFPQKKIFAITDKAGYLSLVDKSGGLLAQKNLNIQSMMSSPVALLGKTEYILAACEKKALCILSLEGTLLSKVELDGVLTGVPFVYNDTIFVSVDQGSLHAIRALKLP